VAFAFLLVTAAYADNIQLTEQRGPGAGQVTLQWAGGGPPYEVYRAASPAGVVAPLNLIAIEPGPSFIDTPPDVPILFYVVTQTAATTCGNGIREAAEQCDDGNSIRLDGCGPDCKFEQVQRTIWFKMQFATDAVCIRNRLGVAVVNSTAQQQLQTSIDSGIADGSITVLLTALGISDLSGTNEGPFPLGFVNGIPETRGGTLPYNGTNDLDWWYNVDPLSVDGSRLPLSTLPAGITAHALTAGPGAVQVPLFAGVAVRMTSTQLSVTTGASSTPLASAAGDPPGHLASENLDPALQSYATCGTTTAAGAGRICGDVVARSLAVLPINPSLVSTCDEGYSVSNSMLDVYVGGCRVFGFITIISASQPDRSDPDAPVAGGGPPYTFSLDAQTHMVNTCRDRFNAVVDLNTCLDSAAYSSFFKLATDRVIPR
jgi:cysteine-rich repeat protein